MWVFSTCRRGGRREGESLMPTAVDGGEGRQRKCQQADWAKGGARQGKGKALCLPPCRPASFFLPVVPQTPVSETYIQQKPIGHMDVRHPVRLMIKRFSPVSLVTQPRARNSLVTDQPVGRGEGGGRKTAALRYLLVRRRRANDELGSETHTRRMRLTYISPTAG